MLGWHLSVKAHLKRTSESTRQLQRASCLLHVIGKLYLKVCCSRDEKTIKTLTAGEQQLAYMKLIRSQDPRYVNVWKFHGERTPCKVVSIRAIEAYYGSKAPRMGSRLAVQAVVRFDTLQAGHIHLSSGLYLTVDAEH